MLGNGNASGLIYTLGGTAFGIDYQLDTRLLIGIAGGYIGGSQWLNGFGGNRYTESLRRGGWPGRCFPLPSWRRWLCRPRKAEPALLQFVANDVNWLSPIDHE